MKKVRELLIDESKWHKGNFAIDSEGLEVSPNDKNACKWCLMGAIKKCYQGAEYVLVLNKVHRKINNIFHWNDSFAKFEDVKRLVDELDI